MATLTEEDEVQEREDQFVTHQQRWATKVRRRSSDMKSFVSDKLELVDNPKITAIMNKNGIYNYMIMSSISGAYCVL